MTDEKIEIIFDSQSAKTDMVKFSEAAAETKRQVSGLKKTLAETFKISGIRDYYSTVSAFGKKTADSLLILQLRLGQLRNAFAGAIMPFVSAFLPGINRGILMLTRFLTTVSQVSAILLDQTHALGMTGKQTGFLENRQKSLGKTMGAVGKKIHRSLASFDQIERLSHKTGGGGQAAFNQEAPGEKPISQEAFDISSRILQFLKPLQEIQFTALNTSLEGLMDAFRKLGDLLGGQFLWAWENVLLPLSEWTIEQLAPSAVEMLSAALGALHAILTPVWEGIQKIMEALTPAAQWLGDVFLTVLQYLKTHLTELGSILEEKSGVIQESFEMLAGAVEKIWQTAEPVLTQMLDVFLSVFDEIGNGVLTLVSAMIDGFSQLTSFISSVFSGDFQGAFQNLREFIENWADTTGELLWGAFRVGIEKILGGFFKIGTALGEVFGWSESQMKNAANSVIGFINRMLQGVISGINMLTDALNQIQFTVPSWIPGIGGNHFGFTFSHLQAPQIPYLAQGAVLPAGQPFLAMVGDQRHGTNVEAPLATIQQAVADVMGDFSCGMMAGFDATTAMQKEILSAILQIHIGEDTIGEAAASYWRKYNVMYGGGIL